MTHKQLTDLELAKIPPLRPPNVDKATATGMIHEYDPRVLSPKVCTGSVMNKVNEKRKTSNI